MRVAGLQIARLLHLVLEQRAELLVGHEIRVRPGRGRRRGGRGRRPTGPARPAAGVRDGLEVGARDRMASSPNSSGAAGPGRAGPPAWRPPARGTGDRSISNSSKDGAGAGGAVACAGGGGGAAAGSGGAAGTSATTPNRASSRLGRSASPRHSGRRRPGPSLPGARAEFFDSAIRSTRRSRAWIRSGRRRTSERRRSTALSARPYLAKTSASTTRVSISCSSGTLAERLAAESSGEGAGAGGAGGDGSFVGTVFCAGGGGGGGFSTGAFSSTTSAKGGAVGRAGGSISITTSWTPKAAGGSRGFSAQERARAPAQPEPRPGRDVGPFPGHRDFRVET